MGLPKSKQRKLDEWYWVEFQGRRLWALRHNESNDEEEYWEVVGKDDLYLKDAFKIIKGPFTEFDIDNASFDLQ